MKREEGAREGKGGREREELTTVSWRCIVLVAMSVIILWDRTKVDEGMPGTQSGLCRALLCVGPLMCHQWEWPDSGMQSKGHDRVGNWIETRQSACDSTRKQLSVHCT